MVAERAALGRQAERAPGYQTETQLRPEIVWLGEPAATDRALVGGKVAPLSRLAARFQVPPGFALTTHAYDLAGAWYGDTPGAEDTVLPDLLRQQVEAAYQALAEQTGLDRPAVAVRSSAVDEDGAATSFAGQHDTYLNVVGVEAICEAIVRCWASARTSRALEYRRQHGLQTEHARLAVLIQQLVLADVSGVTFSANPLTGRRDEVVVNASWGLGESIVGGSVTPDLYVARRDSTSSEWTIVERGLAEKRRMTVAVPGGTREVDVPRLLASRPALSDEQIVETACLADELERAMGFPVDLEWAYRDDHLYLLQCRPITTLDQLNGTTSR